MTGIVSLRRLRALLAPAALGHRRHAGQRRRQGHPQRGLVRRGHHVAGRRGGPHRAARRAGRRSAVGLWFSTTAPAYLDKTNATAIHAALGLPSSVPARRRRRLGALGRRRRARRPAPAGGLAVLSDIRTGLPGRRRRGRRRRRRGGVRSSATGADVHRRADRRRHAPPASSSTAGGCPATRLSRQWEERFGEHAYLPARRGGRHRRPEVGRARRRRPRPRGRHRPATPGPCKAAAKAVGARPEALRRRPDGRRSATPAPPTAGCVLADVLDRAEPGQTIAVVQLADGCDVVAAAHHRRASPARAGRRRRCRSSSPPPATTSTYATFLTWRGFLRREPPRRPEPDRPGRPAVAAHRRRGSTASSAAERRGAASSTSRRRGCRMETRRHRPDDAGAHGRRAGHHRHLHRRPAGLLAVARRWSPRSSTSTAAAASSASSPTSTRPRSRSATGSR